MTTNELTADMIDRSARDFDPLRIILFGSHARGDATPDSDIDLLVVLAEAPDKRQGTMARSSTNDTGDP